MGIKQVNNSNINNMIIGLTGQSGAGKTTFCEVFARRRFTVIDCDDIARGIADSRSFLEELDVRFPDRLLKSNGLLDRAKTARVIFSDSSKRELYNRLIFPYIIYEVIRRIKLSGENILLDAPTLFESGLNIICDKIIAVTADRERCLERITARDGLSCEQAAARIASQNSLEYFREHSDYTIQNNGSLAELERTAERISSQLVG